MRPVSWGRGVSSLARSGSDGRNGGHMRMKYILAALLGILMNTGAVGAGNYPYKVIRIITSEAGRPSDVAARIIAQGIDELLGQSVIVDNRAGVIAAELGAKATPDGYTLLVYGPSLWLLPLLRDKATWDPVRDFLPVTMATLSPNILVVHPALPVKSVAELIALAK